MSKSARFLPFYLLLSWSCSAPTDSTSSLEVMVWDTLKAVAPPASSPAGSAVVDGPSLLSLDYDTMEWTEVVRLDSSIQIQLKYATTDNFVQEKMYDCGRCFLRPEVALAVVEAHRQLQGYGYGLLLLDCFRPHPIQWKLWEKMPDPRFVTHPRQGSMHNRGAAIDLTLIDSLGRVVNMGTPYDFFGREAYHTYTDLPDSILLRRRLLKEMMEAQGFRPIRTEWWHYSFQGRTYALSDMLWKCYE